MEFDLPRSQPQPEFFLAISTINSSNFRSIAGQLDSGRYLDPSNFFAMSFRTKPEWCPI
jgi:hypothetical protein